MQSSLSVELSAIMELLMALVKVINSQHRCGSGEGTSFNAPEAALWLMTYSWMFSLRSLMTSLLTRRWEHPSVTSLKMVSRF
ncbi:uncharacterized protein E5676_scaffold145G00060 [Cucumis melo var. makuwa]|uniref:Uncharacterized protein n=1 Tax=Cucumis melo var. makuwa TaxID=1194695 RepID=A0A5D3BVB6_CUCMM|nr:uncharacterized protein E6C27_scaffold128G002850 [Cucumis melo var. makuwa]TYK02752.1 uncharacterized protein E5676_scaffold145G00060 [Cucumis melo var. makuwa]